MYAAGERLSLIIVAFDTARVGLVIGMPGTDAFVVNSTVGDQSPKPRLFSAATEKLCVVPGIRPLYTYWSMPELASTSNTMPSTMSLYCVISTVLSNGASHITCRDVFGSRPVSGGVAR